MTDDDCNSVTNDSGASGNTPAHGPVWMGAVFLFCYGVVFCREPSLALAEDWLKFHRPNLDFLFASLGKGEVPWWNPHIGLGRPFVSDIQNAVFYPPTYLFAIGGGIGFHLAIGGHLLFALLGVARLTRTWGAQPAVSWIAGLVLVFSGPFTSLLFRGLFFYVFGLCWIPWLLLLVSGLAREWNGRTVVGLGLALAFQFLTGHPQVFWITAVGLGLFLLIWKLSDRSQRNLSGLGTPMLQLAAGMGIGMALTAAVWLPFLDLVNSGNRVDMTAAQAAFGASRPVYLFSLFGIPPYEFVVNSGGNWFVTASWAALGLAGLVSSADARIRALLAVAVFAFVFSLGGQTFVHGLCYELLPGTASFRFPIRMSVWLPIASVIAGAVFVGTQHGNRLHRTAWLGVVGLLAIAQTIGTLVVEEPISPRSSWLPVLFLVLGGIAAHTIGLPHARSRLAPLALGVVLVLELTVTAAFYRQAYSMAGRYGINPTYPTANSVAELLRQAPVKPPQIPPPRINLPPNVIPRNYAMSLGYATHDAYTSLFLKRPWEAIHAAIGMEPFAELNTTLNDGIYGRDPFDIPTVSIDLGAGVNAARIMGNPAPFPRAYLANSFAHFRDSAEALAAIANGHDLLHAPIVEEPLTGMEANSELASFLPVRFQYFGSSELRLQLPTDRLAMLVLNEAWFPGWRAWSNGRELPVVPVNHWMRGALLEPGNNSVTFRFRPRHRLVGGLITALALLMIGLWATRTGLIRAAFNRLKTLQTQN